jgi:hypothetical protein
VTWSTPSSDDRAATYKSNSRMWCGIHDELSEPGYAGYESSFISHSRRFTHRN